MDAHGTISPRLQVISIPQRIALGIGLLGVAEGLGAALLAPRLPPPVRVGRVMIDLVLALGFFAYLRGERVAVAAARGTLSRTVAIALVAAGGAFALVAPGVDPWRRAFRVALALALAAAIALGVGRTLPVGWLRRARALSFAFVIVEMVVAIFAAIEVDAPIALAGLRPAVRAAALRLEDAGYAVPAPLANALTRAAPEAFTERDGRIVATTRLADTLHLLGEDPIPPLSRIIDDASARSEWLHGRLEQCAVLRLIHPPLGGYRDPRYGAGMVEALAECRREGSLQ